MTSSSQPNPVEARRNGKGASVLGPLASGHCTDVSLAQWMALTPHELVAGHLDIEHALLDTMSTTKHPVVPA